MSFPFTINLNQYNGPLDLLYHLVKKDELDILHIPIATVLEQYLDHIAVLEWIDVNAAGDFLGLASTLVEIKSFEMLPGEEVIETELEDPRKELVEQLLAYKRFSDSATDLERRGRLWQQRYPRLANDLPPRPKNLAEEPIREVELWDLVSAFGRIMRESSPQSMHQVVYDDTPIAVHMKRIYNRLKAEERLSFRQLFEPGEHKSKLIGLFLAGLELVRHEHAEIRQDSLFGEIELRYRQGGKSLDFVNLKTEPAGTENGVST
ncbi:MAG TPA: chromosome segregation protein ScpA [Planctomycetaceae bacterium]|nr:chromosome segregation protein ScpA [Planctomycetaceae bacterium]